VLSLSIRSIFEISQDKLFRTHRFLFPTFKNQLYNDEAKREMRDKLLGNIVHRYYDYNPGRVVWQRSLVEIAVSSLGGSRVKK